jgi:predicted transcriptional regulator
MEDIIHRNMMPIDKFEYNKLTKQIAELTNYKKLLQKIIQEKNDIIQEQNDIIHKNEDITKMKNEMIANLIEENETLKQINSDMLKDIKVVYEDLKSH